MGSHVVVRIVVQWAHAFLNFRLAFLSGSAGSSRYSCEACASMFGKWNCYAAQRCLTWK